MTYFISGPTGRFAPVPSSHDHFILEPSVFLLSLLPLQRTFTCASLLKYTGLGRSKTILRPGQIANRLTVLSSIPTMDKPSSSIHGFGGNRIVLPISSSPTQLNDARFRPLLGALQNQTAQPPFWASYRALPAEGIHHQQNNLNPLHRPL